MNKKILFHICCGPCGTASIQKLQKEGYKVVGFYYNPNIYPESEYKKRLYEAKKLAKELSIKLIVPKYNQDEYFDAVGIGKSAKRLNLSKGSTFLIPDKKVRCPKCWRLRLEKMAEEARRLKVGTIGTTLRISPYQNQEKLLKIGRKIAEEYGLEFYSRDLVCEYRHSVELSKEKQMYRQKYCGCIFSKKRT